jgi:uncharacterized protein with FMN-binding domain
MSSLRRSRSWAASLLAGLSLLLADFRAIAEDVLELKTGAKIKGEVVSENEQRVVMKVVVGGKTFTRSYTKSQITALTRDGAAAASAPDGTASDSASSIANTRSKQEVQELIQSEGSKPPSWFASAPLDIPPSLDLSWPEKPPGGWNNQKNVGQFIWDRINPNPGNWQSGVKLMHHLMTVNASNAEVVNRAMGTLGAMYHNLHADYARSAYWFQQSDVLKNPDAKPNQTINLADCYFKLGSREMALELVNKMRAVPLSAIKLLGDLGETDDALKLAERFAGSGSNAVACYLYAGDVCRVAGRLTDAEQYYNKALAASDKDTRNNDHSKRDKQRAEASLAAIKFYQLDPAKVRDGTYTAGSLGYEDQVHVSVTVRNGVIESVKVTQHREKQFYSSVTETPKAILGKQSVVGVDTTSGATITSEAIINATAKSLSQGFQAN